MAFAGTTMGVLCFGLQTGVVRGVGLTLASLHYRGSTPHVAVVGRIVGTEHFRNTECHGDETLQDTLFFAH